MSHTQTWRAGLGPGAAAGLLAGAVAGAAESIWLIRLGSDWRDDYDILVLGPLVYGAFGLSAGGVVGAATAAVRIRRRPDPLRLFGFVLGVVASGFLITVVRFLYARDVLQESPLGPGRQVAWLVVSLAVGLLSWLGLPRLLGRWTSAVGFRECLLGWLLILGFAVAASRLLPRSGTSDFRAQSAASTRPNVLFVMIDTLRADSLSVYGRSDARTPGAVRLAADGIVFEQAISQAPWTRPSVATQITSLTPDRHGARFKASSIDASAISLAESLAEAGYYCIGLYGSVQIAPQWGFARGFHRYLRLREDRVLRELTLLRFLNQRWQSWRRSSLRPGDLHPTAQGTFRRAREEWEAAPEGAPIFLFVHLMDVHDPYFPRSTTGPPILRDERAPATARDTFRRAYQDGVEYTDAMLADFVRWMQTAGLYDDTLIVLVSDHGEEFFEHGGYWHGFTLYEEQIRVPLILKLPQNRLAGRRQPALVRLLDLAPTIASVVGIPPPMQWMGAALIRDGQLIDPQLSYALSETDLEGRVQRALRGTRFKLIRADGAGPRALPPTSLFDLQGDALEQTNLASARGEEERMLEAELARQRGGDLWR